MIIEFQQANNLEKDLRDTTCNLNNKARMLEEKEKQKEKSDTRVGKI